MSTTRSKTRLFSLACISILAVGLVGCSDAASPSGSAPATPLDDEAAIAGIAWGEDANGIPELTFDTPLMVSASIARVVDEGDGASVEPGQLMALDYIVFGGGDGVVQYSTYEEGSAQLVDFTEETTEPNLWKALSGTNVGAQIIFATPDASAVPVDGVYPTIVMAITISGAVPLLDRATGDAVAPVAGLPSVTLADNGAPSIDFSGTEMPTGLVVQPLIKGDGPVVAAGQSLMAHYSGWLWDGTLFDSSWAGGYPISFMLAEGYLIDGWVQGLAGQPVGSQVLLVIPPELGYGDIDQGSIPAGSTLVFVVDILAAY